MASILVSEVDRNVRRLLTKLVERQGHEAIVLEPDVAVPPRADALLVDPASPAAADHILLVRAFYPEVPMVCTNPLPRTLGTVGRGPIVFLPKPFAPDELADAVERALEHATSPV